MNKRESEMNQDFGQRKKKRRSRWANDDCDKAFVPGMPTVVPAGLSRDQEEQYLVQLQIEEISRRLRTGDLGIAPNPEDRSPSPEPIYNSEGKRLNTREYRTRKRLEEERHNLIVKASVLNTEYKPPADYKPPIIRVSDKVMIPQEENPDINFVGLLIGPRGNTLKNLEKDTGAKIIIRGKGSVKEGKIGRKDGQPLPGEDEPLHAYVTANNPENVKKAVEKIKEIIRQGIEVPEGQNDLRRQQLRELALLNGTLRENDGLAKLKQLQQAQTIVTNTIICTMCGGTGHIAQDCKQKRPGDGFHAAMQQEQQQSAVDKAKMDSEYMSLMAELGEGPPPPKNEPQRHSYQSPHHMQQHQQQQNMNAPPPWHQGGPPSHHHHHHHHHGPPNNNNGHHNKPPSLMNMNHQRPPMSQPPPMVAPPPPIASSASMPPPPWSQMNPMSSMSSMSNSSSSVTSSNSYNQGMPPPLMAPPPPPPPSQPNNNSTSYPWQQQQQPPMGIPPPPPPSMSGNMPPWQQPSPVPPPPPGNMMPWQQQAPPPPMSGHNGAPPPPPPHGFNPVAPPPPPPGSDRMSMTGGIPLGVPPPPPPQ